MGEYTQFPIENKIADLDDIAETANRKHFSVTEKNKLTGIEQGATADQTGAQIKAAYEAEADTNAYTDAEQSKLAAVEAGATGDQTGAEIKALYEAEADTNAFTDAEQTKLTNIEANATADQTGAEIKTAYEAELDTNAYTDAEKTKLAGIESGATADQTGAEIKTAYEAELDTNAYTDTEKSKLAGVESGATADQSDAEIETAYNNQVPVMSQATAEAGTSTTPERVTAQRIGQAIAALASGGSVVVEDEGVEVVAVASTLNFTGSGVTAADAGGGEATITVSGGAAPVDSVFGRTGVVAAAASDYDASQVDNDSGVSGATVAAALDAVAAIANAALVAGDIDTLAELNAILTDATLIDTADARLSDARTPTSHGLGGSEHAASTLAQLNAKVSDATLIDTTDARLSDARTPTSHALSSHTGDADQISEGATNLFLTSAERTKLSGIETAADVTDTANVTAAGALMDSEVDANIQTFALPANTTISAFGATVIDDADAAAARTTMGAASTSVATGSASGLMSSTHYTKVEGLPTLVGDWDVGATETINGTENIDLSAASFHNWNVTGNATINLTGTAPSGTILNRGIKIANSSGSDYTITWGTGADPTYASFLIPDGTTMLLGAARANGDSAWTIPMSRDAVELGEHTFATAYTLAATDYLRDGIRATGASPVLTVNTGLSIPAGKAISLIHDGTGNLTFAGTATIEKNADFNAQVMADGGALLYSTGSDTFKLSGALVAA